MAKKLTNKSKSNPEQSDENVFLNLLNEAISKPGVINQAYRAFHRFSLGNQILATIQLLSRGLPVAPIASFNAWKEKGRMVKKGEKAIRLSMPVTVKRKPEGDGNTEEEGGAFRIFVMRPNWFSLDQTEGAEFAEEAKSPSWDADLAMQSLGIEEIHFNHLNGNMMGYAIDRRIAINPVNPLKHKTRFHELAHIVLGHTAEGEMADSADLPRSLKEVEAEGVAYILCSLLDMPGQAESRHYIQGWLESDSVPEKSARHIFTAADKILHAGSPVEVEGSDVIH